MATGARPGDAAVIEHSLTPITGIMANFTVVGTGNMVARFAGCGLAIMTALACSPYLCMVDTANPAEIIR